MARIALEQTGVHLNMAAALFGYKRLLCLVFFVVYAVCTINADSSPSGSPTLTTAYSDDGDCKNPWRTHNQSCYLFMAGEYSFAEANKSCSDQRANLVSISDDNENEFIRRERSSTDPAWIGLYRQTSSCNNLTLCDWMWLDGSQLGFYNWPSHTRPTDSKCVLIEPNGFWSNGRGCDADLDFICERDVLYPTTTSEATTMKMTTGLAYPSPTNSTIDVATPLGHKTKEEDKPIIIGCVVGGLVLVAIVTVVVVVLLKRHRTSRPINQPVEVADEEIPKVAKQVRNNQAYEDGASVETLGQTNVAFKPSPGNTDTGAHGVGDNPHHIYSEAIKKQDRPGSEGILVKENTLYGYGK